MKKFALLSLILLSIAFVSGAQNSQTVTFKLKITSHLPFGWGDTYQAVILDVIDGGKIQFGDTILFGRIDFSGEDYFSTGDIRTISFKNTHKKNPNTYLPAISGTVSRLNDIWEIVDITK